MLHHQNLQVLILVGASLTSWAAPIESLIEKTDCESKETTKRLASQHDELCVVSATQLPSSANVKSLGETELISESGRHDEYKESSAVSDATMKQAQVVQRTDESHEQHYLDSSVEKSSATKQNSKRASSATPLESFPVDHILGFEKDAASLVTVTSAVQKNFEPGVASSILPFHLTYNRPAPKTSSQHTLEGTTETLKPLKLNQEAKLEIETSKNTHSTIVSFKTKRLVITETTLIVSSSSSESVHQSSWTINPAIADLTTLRSDSLQTGVFENNKEQVAEKKLIRATEIRKKAFGPRLLQPDLNLSSRLVDFDAWTESVNLQEGEETSVLPSSQEVSTEATMSSKDLPLIFEDVTPSSSSALVSELSVSVVPGTGMLREAELEQTVSMDTDQTPHDVPLSGPSDWPTQWQMSGAETSDTVMPSQISIEVTRWSPSVSATTPKITEIISTHTAVLKPTSGLQELHSEEDEEDDDIDDSDEEEEEEESDEELTEAPEHSTTRSPYSLIPPPPDWEERNQGLIRSWFELIREKAGYVSGMLAPVGIGIAGALMIVGALYGIRMIHRKRKNTIKQQRRKQPTEVRHRHDHAMLLADSSEDEF